MKKKTTPNCHNLLRTVGFSAEESRKIDEYVKSKGLLYSRFYHDAIIGFIEAHSDDPEER